MAFTRGSLSVAAEGETGRMITNHNLATVEPLKTDTIGEQPFGRYREVVLVESSIAIHMYMYARSMSATSESWSFANCFSSS